MDAVPDIVDAVLYFLGFLSILIWAVGIAKAIALYRGAGDDRHFMQGFTVAMDVRDLQSLMSSAQGRLARICRAGMHELAALHRMAAIVDGDDKRELLLHALKQQAHEEQARMENGLGILASVGSTAPFIGLFGTVWGIMNALTNISEAGSAGLDVVAGPIGEALIATAIGIATAIPAVLAYNYFVRKVRLTVAGMDNFSSSFHLLAVKSGFKHD